jgi:hypothetical protein
MGINYNSVHIAKQLYERGTEGCEKISQNAGLPNDLKDHQQTLRKGETTFCRDREVLHLSWMAITVVTIIKKVMVSL